MSNICGIYKITNIINNKSYIGQTWRGIIKRFQEHKLLNSKGCPKLYNAFNKYGSNNFKIELMVFTHTQELADYWEDYFIKYFNSIINGYNIKNGGSKGQHSEETKRKIAASHIGKTPTVATRNKISKSNSGKVTPLERKQKISASLKGKKPWNTGKTGVFSDDTLAKLSEILKGNCRALGSKRTEEQNKLNSERNMGDKNGFYGKKHSIETKAKMAGKNTWTKGSSWKLIDGKRVYSKKE